MDLAPEWLRTPLLAALLAALGYVAKLLIEEFTKWRLRRDERQSKLVALQSLLLASRRVYEIQNDLIRKLYGEIRLSGKQLEETASYDEFARDGIPRDAGATQAHARSDTSLHYHRRATAQSSDIGLVRGSPDRDQGMIWQVIFKRWKLTLCSGKQNTISGFPITLSARSYIWPMKTSMESGSP